MLLISQRGGGSILNGIIFHLCAVFSLSLFINTEVANMWILQKLSLQFFFLNPITANLIYIWFKVKY